MALGLGGELCDALLAETEEDLLLLVAEGILELEINVVYGSLLECLVAQLGLVGELGGGRAGGRLLWDNPVRP